MSAKAEAVKAALRANPTFSDRRIAAECGASHVTVREIRLRHFPNQKRRVGRDGKTRETPLAENADLLGELNDCLSRAEAVLLKVKRRLSLEKQSAEDVSRSAIPSLKEIAAKRARGLSFDEIWKGHQPMLPSKTRPQLIKHLKEQAKRIDHAFGDTLYRH
jgi:hypothetical protein